MADLDRPQYNVEASHRSQERHDAYLLTLTFTLTGLAVQTAAFGPSFWRNNIELVGWAALLVSGLIGLLRSERTAQVFGVHAKLAVAENQASQLRRQRLQGKEAVHIIDEGRTVPIDQQLARAESTVTQGSAFADELGHKLALRYRVQRALFGVGIMTLMVSRGWAPLSAILFRILHP